MELAFSVIWLELGYRFKQLEQNAKVIRRTEDLELQNHYIFYYQFMKYVVVSWYRWHHII